MSTVWLIARRELQGYLLSPLGYVVIASILLIDGLLFNGFAMGGEKLSYEVLNLFFFFSSGTTMVASVFITMRLFAEERQTGTLVLLQTSPSSELQLVLGKFVGAYLFLLLLTLLTLYMPLLVLVNGSVTWGHLFAGYLGLALLGAACVGLGTLASSLAPNQILSAVLSGAFIVALLVMWMLARKIDGPLGHVVAYLSLFDKHFQPFSRGVVLSSALFYYLSVTYASLLAATAVLGGRRWRG
jgi:ABC-2 type transport system permease protein